jgi:hypothetical protein
LAAKTWENAGGSSTKYTRATSECSSDNSRGAAGNSDDSADTDTVPGLCRVL